MPSPRRLLVEQWKLADSTDIVRTCRAVYPLLQRLMQSLAIAYRLGATAGWWISSRFSLRPVASDVADMVEAA